MRAVERVLSADPMPVRAIAAHVYGVEMPTASQRVSVTRALHSLAARGAAVKVGWTRLTRPTVYRAGGWQTWTMECGGDGCVLCSVGVDLAGGAHEWREKVGPGDLYETSARYQVETWRMPLDAKEE